MEWFPEILKNRRYYRYPKCTTWRLRGRISASYRWFVSSTVFNDSKFILQRLCVCVCLCLRLSVFCFIHPFKGGIATPVLNNGPQMLMHRVIWGCGMEFQIRWSACSKAAKFCKFGYSLRNRRPIVSQTCSMGLSSLNFTELIQELGMRIISKENLYYLRNIPEKVQNYSEKIVKKFRKLWV